MWSLALLAVTASSSTSAPLTIGILERFPRPLHASDPLARRVRSAVGYRIGAEAVDPLGAFDDRLAEALSACSGDRACQIDRLAARGAKLVLILEQPSPTELRGVLWDVPAGAALAEEARSMPADQPLGVLAAVIEPLLDRTGLPRGGRLIVDVEPEDAELAFSPPPLSDAAPGGPPRCPPGKRCVAPQQLLFAPGEVEIRAAREGHVPFTTRAWVSAGNDVTVPLVLQEEQSSLFASRPFWIGVGVVIATAALIGLSVVAANSDSSDVCRDPTSRLCLPR